MAFDKGKFISDFTQSGMEEAQAELLANKQADMFGQFSTKQDLAALHSGLQDEQESLRRELDSKIGDAKDQLRREANEQAQKTRLLLDDVRGDVRKTEARIEGALKTGFAAINHRFNVLVVSNTTVIVAVIGFVVFLFRG